MFLQPVRKQRDERTDLLGILGADVRHDLRRRRRSSVFLLKTESGLASANIHETRSPENPYPPARVQSLDSSSPAYRPSHGVPDCPPCARGLCIEDSPSWCE